MSRDDLLEVLLVDDEQHVLDGLVLHLRRRFAATTANSGEEAVALLTADPSRFAVVVSDMRMPGMDGAAFLARAHAVAPDATRMLLTGHAEMDAAIAAVNEGRIFRFLTKPCPAAVLVPAIEAAVEQHRLVTAQKALLRETFAGSIAVLTSLLELAQPRAFSRAGRVSRRVGELARWTGRDAWQVEIAAQLSQIAAVMLPPDVLDRMESDEPLQAEDQDRIRRLPAMTADLLARIPRLEGVVGILRGVESDDDGVPWESRALAVLLEMDSLEQRGTKPVQAVRLVRARRGARDREVLDEIDTMLEDHAATHSVGDCAPGALLPGMLLAEDVRDDAGNLLFARGYEVTGNLVEQVRATLARAGVTRAITVEVPARVARAA